MAINTAFLKKETGGKAEVLLLLNEYRTGDHVIRALSNRELRMGWCIRADDSRVFRVVKQEGKIFFLEPEFPFSELPILLSRHGKTPIPHYLRESGLSEDELRVPETSIMCLVDVFLQYKRSPVPILELYSCAVAERMRFYSFGDGMLIF